MVSVLSTDDDVMLIADYVKNAAFKFSIREAELRFSFDRLAIMTINSK